MRPCRRPCSDKQEIWLLLQHFCYMRSCDLAVQFYPLQLLPFFVSRGRKISPLLACWDNWPLPYCQTSSKMLSLNLSMETSLCNGAICNALICISHSTILRCVWFFHCTFLRPSFHKFTLSFGTEHRRRSQPEYLIGFAILFVLNFISNISLVLGLALWLTIFKKFSRFATYCIAGFPVWRPSMLI